MPRLASRQIAVLGAAGAAFAALLIGVLGYAGWSQRPVQVGAYAVPYDQRVLDDPLEILLVQSDGQAFATLARDPSLARAVDDFRTPDAAAYRAQRPLLPIAAWALSAGRPGWVPPALSVLAVAGTALTVVALGALTAHRGGPVRYVLLVLLLPGTYSTLAYLGPEPLALGLAATGIVMWERNRLWPAVALFALSGLTRETMLIIPGVLLLADLAARRRSRLGPMAVPFVTYAAWVAVLQLRLGALPTDHGDGALALPFRGLVDGLAASETPGGTVYLVLFAAIVLVGVVRAPRDHLALIGLAYLAFGTVMGVEVWVSWEFFGRILLPGVACAVVAILGSIELRDQVASRSASLAAQHQ